ncbi:hypothetical protein M741_10320 [Neisseria gonorrhoeae NOR_2011_03-06]|nr:hypothetical protein M741_10320 [Neisseria gonorrhoeae NOR_2011_03-06]
MTGQKKIALITNDITLKNLRALMCFSITLPLM